MIDRSSVGSGTLDAWLARLLYRWTGNTALITTPITPRLDLFGGLAVVAALDRLLTRGSDRIVGLWAGLGFLAGSWPALAAIGLPAVVLGRRGHTLTGRAIWPALAIVVVGVLPVILLSRAIGRSRPGTGGGVEGALP